MNDCYFNPIINAISINMILMESFVKKLNQQFVIAKTNDEERNQISN